ncbi:TPA: nucleotidyl transferase AbiEii/AbiGii toxin family protein [Escherichia coli]|nr:nucleotidyl transferase AbiEii/AbiGii toxin family protein [Escherichia coli]HAI7083058.1 nucleotidyl transferase AbiEii/AbiGii toxin family protein [Escherichia coli]HAX8505421.1 nucleotidyl transferase AbiEii/AbiGii toxin family protein [Escherichia coli]
MPELTSLFPDVADALDIESVAIVEKDYFVVDLLRLLKEIKPETHTLVFAGGTALSKAGISLNRMSEDIDIKLVPTENFMQNGRDKRRKIRKEIVQIITDVIHNSDIFSLDNENARITRDEYRYNEISVRYPQTFAQVPCLRPFIKLKLMESTLLEHPESRDIYSLVTELTGKGTPVTAFPCATILSTQAEKLISMMRRTAAHLRNPEQQDDEFLVRHIYDNYCIVREKGVNVPVLKNFVQICIHAMVTSTHNFVAHQLMNLRKGWMHSGIILYTNCAFNDLLNRWYLVIHRLTGKKPIPVSDKQR